MLIARFALLVACALSMACTPTFFSCSRDSECAGVSNGRCEIATGFCSAPDAKCASGYRYVAHSSATLSGECVTVVYDLSSFTTPDMLVDASAGINRDLATASYDMCGGSAFDPNNCGGCGIVCPTGQSCNAGVCGCPARFPNYCADDMGGFCTDQNTDNANCGACGNACQPGQLCQSAASEDGGSGASCVETCSQTPTLYSACGSYCANLEGDANNCGSCGASCSSSNVTAACASGLCDGACNAGYADCNNDKQSDGCETATDSDSQNCGACAVVCPNNEVCSHGTCYSPRVLLVAAEDAGYLSDVQTALVAQNVFASVATYDVTFDTPTLDDLAPFDVVLVWSDYPYGDPNALGNVLADYYDGGGRVVVAASANGNVDPAAVDDNGVQIGRLAGRFGTVANGYMFTDNTAPCSFTAATLGTVLDPSSAVLANVNTLSINQHSNGAAVNSGIVVAVRSDGAPLVITGNVVGRTRVDVNVWPPQNADSATGDGYTLLANALLFAN